MDLTTFKTLKAQENEEWDEDDSSTEEELTYALMLLEDCRVVLYELLRKHYVAGGNVEKLEQEITSYLNQYEVEPSRIRSLYD